MFFYYHYAMRRQFETTEGISGTGTKALRAFTQPTSKFRADTEKFLIEKPNEIVTRELNLELHTVVKLTSKIPTRQFYQLIEKFKFNQLQK